MILKLITMLPTEDYFIINDGNFDTVNNRRKQPEQITATIIPKMYKPSNIPMSDNVITALIWIFSNDTHGGKFHKGL